MKNKTAKIKDTHAARSAAWVFDGKGAGDDMQRLRAFAEKTRKQWIPRQADPVLPGFFGHWV
jgi:hypothetical protein